MKVMLVEFPSPLGLPYHKPVRGLIACAPEPVGLHVGLQEDRGVAVSIVPLSRKAFAHLRQDHRGQVEGCDPGEDKKTGIVHDEVKGSLALFKGPADVPVPGRHLPSGGAEAQCGHEAIAGVDEIAHLGSWKRFVPEVMVSLDQFVPKSGTSSPPHDRERQFSKGTGREANRFSRLRSRCQTGSDASVSVDILRRGQRDQSVAVHAKHGDPAGHVLPAAVRA